MRYAIIQNGVVANIVEADGPLPGLQMVDAGEAHIGHLFDGDSFSVPTPTLAQLNAPTLSAITALESTVTPRRIREAVTTDAGKTWLVAVDSQIAALRGSLVK